MNFKAKMNDANNVFDDETRLQTSKKNGATQVVTRQRVLSADPDPPTRLAIASAARLHHHHILSSGSLIKNRFRLEGELGRGGMGVVYAARDLVREEVGDKDSLVAIKLLSDDFKDHPDALRMLQQECKKAQGLAHPNIVTVFDFDRDENTVYMTMELLSGSSLSDYLKKRPFKGTDHDEIMPILTDIVSGLDYAHRQNIVHSDLKPANIHLTKKGAKILDFGIARAVMDSEVNKTDGHPGDMEEVEPVALTPSYASPEMFRGTSPDPRDDIYALACIAYELLAGKHPFERRSAKEALEKRLVPERIKGLNDRQWNALLKGLALEREKRIGSANEFLSAFLPKKKEPWKMASIALAVVVFVSVGYLLMKPPKIVPPDLFENPPAAAELTKAQQIKVNEILEVADVHMMVGRLISPPGSNALDEIKKALDLHPYDRNAIAALKKLLEKLLQQAKLAIDNGKIKRANQLIEEGLKVHDKHKGFLLLKKRLNSTQN